jgi:hypothetical protein
MPERDWAANTRRRVDQLGPDDDDVARDLLVGEGNRLERSGRR